MCNRDPLQAEPSDARPHRTPLGVADRRPRAPDDARGPMQGRRTPPTGPGARPASLGKARTCGNASRGVGRHELVEELVRPQIFLLVDHLAELMRNRIESSAGQKWQRFRELRGDSVVVQVAMRRYVPTRVRHSQGWVNQQLGFACVEGVEHESNRG